MRRAGAGGLSEEGALDKFPKGKYNEILKKPFAQRPEWLAAVCRDAPTTSTECQGCKCTSHSTAECKKHSGMPVANMFDVSGSIQPAKTCRYCRFTKVQQRVARQQLKWSRITQQQGDVLHRAADEWEQHEPRRRTGFFTDVSNAQRAWAERDASGGGERRMWVVPPFCRFWGIMSSILYGPRCSVCATELVASPR